MSDLYLPRLRPSEITEAHVQLYLSNVLSEMDELSLNADEMGYLRERIFGRFIRESTRPYFEYHFLPLMELAVRQVFAHRRNPKVLDLGCGTGLMSLLFALLGAEVVGLDIDANAITLCEKRRELYSSESGDLSLQFVLGDVFEVAGELGDNFDVVYSLFAFNLMQPTSSLVPLCLERLASRGRLLISDGNTSCLFRRFSPRPGVYSPQHMAAILEDNGCSIEALHYGCYLPPVMARVPILFRASRALEPIAMVGPLRRYGALSYSVVADKR